MSPLDNLKSTLEYSKEVTHLNATVGAEMYTQLRELSILKPESLSFEDRMRYQEYVIKHRVALESLIYDIEAVKKASFIEKLKFVFSK